MKTAIKKKLKTEFKNFVDENYSLAKEIVKDALYNFQLNCNKECDLYNIDCWKCALNSQEFLNDLYNTFKFFKIFIGGDC